ncbi:MAG TPA: hypothetical protein VF583_02140 [Bradyrhizobium sp.]
MRRLDRQHDPTVHLEMTAKLDDSDRLPALPGVTVKPIGTALRSKTCSLAIPTVAPAASEIVISPAPVPPGWIGDCRGGPNESSLPAETAMVCWNPFSILSTGFAPAASVAIGAIPARRQRSTDADRMSEADMSAILPE